MEIENLKNLLTKNILLPDERFELVQLIGRCARLEVVNANAIALVDVLPPDLSDVNIRKPKVKKALVKLANRKGKRK